ncbi:hypothetical protein ACJX0J_011857, partial [Zea mays]
VKAPPGASPAPAPPPPSRDATPSVSSPRTRWSDGAAVSGHGKSEVKAAKGEEKPVLVVAAANMPCMDRLREELSCAICLDICFEPTTTPCGHSFCMRCLRHAAAKCGKRCPKCRQFISSSSKSCTVNTVLWNTIQLLFPSEFEARKGLGSSPSPCDKDDVRANRFSQGGSGMRTRSRSSGSGFISSEGRTRSSFIEPGASANCKENGPRAIWLIEF